MVRVHRNRLFIFGCIALFVGIVHLGVFYSETVNNGITSHTKKQIISQNSALSHLKSYRTGRNISQHIYDNNDYKNTHGDEHEEGTAASVEKFKILENKKGVTEQTSNEFTSCDDKGGCGDENKIQNKPGELDYIDSQELITKPSNFQYSFAPDALKLTVITDKKLPNDSYFHLRPNILNPLPKNIVLHNPNLCSLRSGRPPFLLAIVPTVVDHVFVRKTIRNTWGSVARNGGQWGNVTLQHTVRLLFVLGSNTFSPLDMAVVKQEAQDYGDLLLSDFVDSYRNLSLKIAVGLAWSNQFCQGVNHVVKVDEDTFLFLPKLLALLQRTDLQYRKYVMGFPHLNPNPSVLRRGKWRVNPTLYPLDSYPRYVYGHSYVVSGTAVKTILSAYLRMPFNNNEDALFTGILPVVTDTTRLGHRTFAFVLRHEMECHVARGSYVSLTSCCKAHHIAIFNAIKTGTCHWYKMNEIQEPGCKFSGKKTTVEKHHRIQKESE